jgi:hypothetical protein
MLNRSVEESESLGGEVKDSYPDPPLHAPPSMPPGSGLEAQAVQHQLEQLFGGSLVGPWPELEQQLRRAPKVRRRRRWWLVGLAALLALGVHFGLHPTIPPALERKTLDRRAHYAEDLATFLHDGELEPAAEFLGLMRGSHADLDPGDPHLDLMIRVEAAIYRYQDADPARLARIRPYLETSSREAPSPERLIASLTVLSCEERASRWSSFEALRAPMANDPEFSYLLATTLERRGDLGAARTAWEHSADLGPVWLSHRFEQAEFERRQGDAAAAARVVTRMMRADPESAWSRLASSEFRIGPLPAASTQELGRASRVPPPVHVFHAELFRAIEAAKNPDLDRAKRHVTTAATVVNGQPAFLFDAFDWLLGADFPALARELTNSRGWPADSEMARKKLARLSRTPNAKTTRSASGAPPDPPEP